MFGHRLSLPVFTLFVLNCIPVLAKPFDKRWDDLATKHSWSSIPEGWEFHDMPSKEHEIQIRIGLKQRNPQALIETLLAVSDPAHANYGHHLSKEEVDELVKPHPESVEMVDEWLQHNGVNVSCMTRSTSGEWISLTIPVEHAERLLGSCPLDIVRMYPD
jgi:tripeptidyl-peptidase I